MAAKDLAKIRTKFVEAVSKELINQLLDDLLEDGTLNDGEKDSILEENRSKNDKARDLIDVVKRKGDKASRKLMDHLKSRDPNLFPDLGRSCDQSAAPPAAPQEKEKIYPVTKNSIQNRVALLITNIKFTNEKLNRRGAEKDEENMEKLLKDLGYEVVKHTNLNAKAIDEALVQFSEHRKLKDTDSVFVVIMSHGKRGKVLGVDWKHHTPADEEPDEFLIDNIYKHLDSQKCGALVDKPKIIIIQACRGEEEGSVLLCDSVNQPEACDAVPDPRPDPPAAEDDIEDDTQRCVHREKDFISLLSSTPDTVSYRHKDCGSFLIQYVTEVFNTNARKCDIYRLFIQVMQRFEEFCPGNKRQMATIDRHTQTKSFYFFPNQ